MTNFGKIFFLILNFIGCLNADLYPNYNLSTDPLKIVEWSENRALAYITTVRLFDYDHHIFQYRRYPCQFFYTDEIQLHYGNETLNQCLYNTTTNEYEFNFQLHLDSRHVEPYILKNFAVQCNYTNCSLSLLNINYIQIGWNSKGRERNPNCSFDINQPYNIHRNPYTISEMIPLRCKTLSACNRSKLNLEHELPTLVQLFYGSSYELETPYCSLEKSVRYVIEANLGETNRLLQQLVAHFQRKLKNPKQRKQAKLKERIRNN